MLSVAVAHATAESKHPYRTEPALAVGNCNVPEP